MYTVKDLAVKLNRSEETIRRLIRSGKLKYDNFYSNKEGYIVSEETLNKFLNENPIYRNGGHALINKAKHNVIRDFTNSELYKELLLKEIHRLTEIES